MPEDPYARYTQPETFLADEFVIFDTVAIPLPPGTPAPPRPPRRERVAGREWPVTEPFEVFECRAIPLPPGTPAPPRPAGRERGLLFRLAVPGTDPVAAAVVADLLRRVQSVIDELDADPNGLDALRRAADALPRAG